MISLIHIFIVSVLFCTGYCDSCKNAEISSKSFTTQDATIVTNIAYISEFSVKCGSGSLSHAYADVEGTVVPVFETAPSTFQVSWTEEIKNARRGEIKIRLFDEDGYTALRKALRANEDISTVSPLFSVSVSHPGAFNGPWLKSEFLAVALSVVVAYLALSSRSKLLS
ncbi:hypothetical protein PPYR_05893 [Photinus pyralis]|uniref:Translocon-associated protein subunit delta n=1 Tax=Photinus pyralis TaxID=7054 RepID=A0A5N4AW27_PHOPY|nr:translocon-associated protein subunit delta [Photinus pyralis]KAB0801539.1 hypothetical protein PPYR_05893 [Photinus pyralis]